MNRELNYINRLVNLSKPLLFFSLSILIIFWKFFVTMNGYFDFGNMLSIFDSRSYISSVFWLFNPYQNNGFILLTPSTQLGWVFIARILFGFSLLFGVDGSIKLLVFFSMLFLSTSFYLLICQFVPNKTSRYVSTLFFVYNPFSLELFANGDFYYFIFESFLLLSLASLSYYYKSGGSRHEIFTLSLVLLFLSASFNDAFYVGVFDFFIYGIISIYFFHKANHGKFLHSSLKFILMMGLLIPISFPLLLGFLFSPISLTPTSPLALPVSTYINNGIGFLNTLIMKSYPPNIAWTSLAAYSVLVLELWDIILVILIILAFALGFIYKNKKAILFSLLSIGSALLASGSKGPLSKVLIWAYTHIYGFQLLNYPYIITWLVTTILYSFLFAIIIDMLFTIELNKSKPTQKFRLHSILSNLRKPLKYLFVFLIVIVISFPIADQGFYGKNGINSVHIPSNYRELSTKLIQLDQNSYYGVSFLNPSPYIFFNNSTNCRFTNPVIYDIPIRTPAIPGYITEPLPSYNFFNWAYYEFYSNSTRYFPEIMASVGYKYFVDLFNTNSADFYPLYMTELTMNVNASKKLSHQYGISEIALTRTYSIYRYQYNFSLVNKVNGYSVFAGNYNLITTSMNDGLQLLKVAPLFIPDTLNLNITSLLNSTSSIIEFNSSGVKDLILSHSPNYSSIFKVSNISKQWANSFSELTDWYVNEVAQTAPFLEASSNASITIPIHKNDYGETLWIKVLESDVPGNTLKVRISNKTLDTFSTYNETLNSNTTGFKWLSVNLPEHFHSSAINLSFSGDYNGIESYSIEPKSWYNENFRYFNSIVSKRNITIINLGKESMNQLSKIFNNNSSLYGLIPLKSKIVPTEEGFSISGLEKGTIYIRIPWNGFSIDISKVITMPSYDSMGTLLKIPVNSSNLQLVSTEFSIQIIGYLVSLVTVINVVIYSIVKRKRKIRV